MENLYGFVIFAVVLCVLWGGFWLIKLDMYKKIQAEFLELQEEVNGCKSQFKHKKNTKAYLRLVGRLRSMSLQDYRSIRFKKKIKQEQKDLIFFSTYFLYDEYERTCSEVRFCIEKTTQLLWILFFLNQPITFLFSCEKKKSKMFFRKQLAITSSILYN